VSASQRRKGAAFERLVAQWYREAMPGAHVSRGVQAWEKSLDPDLRMPFFAPECKCQIRPNIYAAMAQAEANAGDRFAVVVRRKSGTNGSDPPVDLVTLRADDAMLLLRQWWDAYGRKEWVG